MIKSLTEALLEANIVNETQLQDIVSKSAIQKETIANVIVNNSFVDETKLAVFIAQYLNIPFISLSNKKTDKNVIQLVPEKYIREYNVFPLFKVTNSIVLAMIDPFDSKAREEIESFTHLRVEPVVVTVSDMSMIINKWMGSESSINKIIESLDKKGASLELLEEGGIFRNREDLGPVNKLAFLIIHSAINDRASDIHLEPKQGGLDVRYRLDGVLHKLWTLPNNLCQPLISSIKILAKMDIVEKRLPLDGSFRIQLENKIIDIRVSSFPLIHGEKIVLRLLDQESTVLDLDNLGMGHEMHMQVNQMINRNFGIFLVTGPTGSGKTTTLYSILNQIKNAEKNIVTIEDPVEYHIDLINQSEINEKCGLTFSRGLRSVLRQDPDVILIGEIRDKETAQIAFQAALTGHLVFSTLHTNDTASSIARLIDMEVEPYLISSVLVGVLSQRLVRKSCCECMVKYTPDEKMLNWGKLMPEHDYTKGKGCKYCRETGYKGRTGLFELLVMNDELKNAINQKQYSELEIRNSIEKAGFISLKADGLNKVNNNITTIDEVIRVVQ